MIKKMHGFVVGFIMLSVADWLLASLTLLPRIVPKIKLNAYEQDLTADNGAAVCRNSISSKCICCCVVACRAVMPVAVMGAESQDIRDRISGQTGQTV